MDIFKGILEPLGRQPPPNWIDPTNRANLNRDRVFLLSPDNNHLIAKLELFRNSPNNYYTAKHICYIKTNNNTIFRTELELLRIQDIPNPGTRIFVRIPTPPHNPVYTGLLHRVRSAPLWVR